ncbi:MAG: CHASE2 domain-containing protein [Ideonella sp.]|nr:CHASE2 domain-containing protein [Ideonella sp.]MBL0149952.1 CHASE2 domain-containing protein [Ideonella sp.]
MTAIDGSTADTEPGWFHHVFHHGLVAAVVASLVGVLHFVGYLGWLDATILRLLGTSTAASSGTVPANLPHVLLIGPGLYETAFRQTSPLDRAQLAQLVETILKARPALLAIDLDLSPSSDGPDAGQTALFEALSKAAAAGTKVVFTLPFRVVNPSLRAAKFKWLKELCAVPGVDVASADLVTHSGTVLMFDDQSPSVGVVAHRALTKGSDGGHGLCGQLVQAGGEWADLLLAPAFLESFRYSVGFGSSLKNFNAGFFSHAHELRHELTSVGALPSNASGMPLNLQGQTVFLGSGFNPSDKFELPLATASGVADGVEVHAAIQSSLRSPVPEVNGAAAFLIDIIVGIAAASFFDLVWGIQRRQHHRWRQHGNLVNYLGTHGLWAVNLVLLLLAVLGLVVVARKLFIPGNLWINPGPIVIGVYIKFMLARRDPSHDNGIANSRAATMWIERSAVILIVAAGVATVVLHH